MWTIDSSRWSLTFSTSRWSSSSYRWFCDRTSPTAVLSGDIQAYIRTANNQKARYSTDCHKSSLSVNLLVLRAGAFGLAGINDKRFWIIITLESRPRHITVTWCMHCKDQEQVNCENNTLKKLMFYLGQFLADWRSTAGGEILAHDIYAPELALFHSAVSFK